MGLARLIGWTTLMEDGGMVTVATGQRPSNLASFSLEDWSTALGPYPVVPTPTQRATMGRTRRRAPNSLCELPQVPFPFSAHFPTCQGLGFLPALGSLQTALSLSWAALGSLPQAPAQNFWADRA